ncbi:MAG: hypothetical protein K0S71_1772 [Clostridia bacterium]|jgi:hypothetical protein|nr:hypothetical protein [Clostridia bacterium]
MKLIKMKSLILSLVVTSALLAGCAAKEAPVAETPAVEAPATETPAAETPAAEPVVDAVTTASLVDNEAAFEAGISKDGTWIISTLKDLTFDKELVLDGEFKNGKKNDDGTDAIQRKIALYTQDENKTVTNRFTLTAPKLTVTSPNARIQGGTFVGDVYVEAENFSIVDAKVEGNVYFASEELKSTFKLEKEGTVSGATEVKK